GLFLDRWRGRGNALGACKLANGSITAGDKSRAGPNSKRRDKFHVVLIAQRRAHQPHAASHRIRYFSLCNEGTETRASVSNAATNAQDPTPEYSCNPVLLSIKSPIHAAFASRGSRRRRRRNFAKARCRAGACYPSRPRARPKKVGRIFGPRRWISAVPDW